MRRIARGGALVLVTLAGCAAPGEDTGSSSAAVTVCGTTTIKGHRRLSRRQRRNGDRLERREERGNLFRVREGDREHELQRLGVPDELGGMKSAGIVRGAYHFFHADVDPTAQATFFLAAVGDALARRLARARSRDDERANASDDLSEREDVPRQAVKTATRRRPPLLYTSPRVPLELQRARRVSALGRELRRVVPRRSGRVDDVRLLAEHGDRIALGAHGRGRSRFVQRNARRAPRARRAVADDRLWRADRRVHRYRRRHASHERRFFTERRRWHHATRLRAARWGGLRRWRRQLQDERLQRRRRSADEGRVVRIGGSPRGQSDFTEVATDYRQSATRSVIDVRS